MEITEVRIMPKDINNKKLRAYAAVTFDDSFVVRNIKIIEGNNGYFVAMPARKAKVLCKKCYRKIEAGGRFCSLCGAELFIPDNYSEENSTHEYGHHDIAHPINQQFREYLQKKILSVYLEKKDPSNVISEAVDIIKSV